MRLEGIMRNLVLLIAATALFLCSVDVWAGSWTGFVGFLTIFGGVSVALHLGPLTLKTLSCSPLSTTLFHILRLSA